MGTTFAEDIEEEAEGVEILGFGWNNYDTPDEEAYGYGNRKPVPQDLKGKLLTWDQARPLLDYHYDPGYGASDCHAVFVWTQSDVIFVVQYDGSTSIYKVPCNLREGCMPIMPGG